MVFRVFKVILTPLICGKTLFVEPVLEGFPCVVGIGRGQVVHSMYIMQHHTTPTAMMA